MVLSSIDDPDSWHERAVEARTMAEQLRDPAAKAALLKIAEGYEYLAAQATRRPKREC
jgi:hypothetical protein